MIITVPPDAKVPQHLYSYASLPTTRNPFASPEDPPRPSDVTYPPTRSSLAESELPPAYVEPPAPPDTLSPQPDKTQIRRRRRKFKLLASGILCVYVASTTILLVLFLTGHLIRKRTATSHQWPSHGAYADVLPDGYRPLGSPLSDGSAIVCNDWTSSKTSYSPSGAQPQYTDYLQYSLQPNTNTTKFLKLFVHAGKDAASSGSLTVASDDSISAPFIDVTMTYRDRSIRNRTSVCVMRTIDSVGLGIYTSNSSAAEDPSFDLTLHLPARVFVDQLVTQLDRFTQNIGRPRVHFKTPMGLLKLTGAFSPLMVSGIDVTAQNIEAETSFSTIWGDFTTSESLTLKTSQAAINVNVSLVRLTDDSRPVSLSLTTENAIVQSAITVSTTANTTCADQSVSDFTIHATSANAPVSVVVMHEKGSSTAKIDVAASSAYAPVVVSLDPFFEGTFALSSGVGADLDSDSDVPDPSGQARERRFLFTETNSFEVKGSVRWDMEPEEGMPVPMANPLARYGSADLTTQHAKAVLYLKKKCTGKSCPSLSFPVAS